jgi:catechol 2,3-dioxygenase-like lactoylglutathione lyase family enzyme
MAPLRIRGLDHVVLRTEKLDETLRFYREALGCPIERAIAELGLYQLRAGEALIDVVDGKFWQTTGGPGESHYHHFCLQVGYDDAAELVADLDRAGVPHGDAAERYGATGNGMSVYATDPDGRTVELKCVGRAP